MNSFYRNLYLAMLPEYLLWNLLEAKNGGIGGGLLKHLLERLPGRVAQQSEFAGVVFENGAQKLGDGEDILSVADLLEDVRIEPLGEKQNALLLA